MKEQRFVFGKGGDAARAVACINDALQMHDVEVLVKQHRNRRTDQQNRYLWGVVYKTILQHLPGWDAEDVHEYCLGSWSGWDVLEGLGKKRLKPIRRSSSLNTVEFNEYIEFIQRTMAERGIQIPNPGEDLRL